MEVPPVALLPCRLMLRVAGMLVAPAKRSDWEQEWFAELWCRLVDGQHENGSRKRLLLIYRTCLGCFKDAWWHFHEEPTCRSRMLEQARSPGFCLALLGVILWACVLASGRLTATRQILFPQCYIDQAHIAVVSRTGRLEPVRRGIPYDLALEWKKQSRFVGALAMCSFPHRTRMAANGSARDVTLLKGTPGLISVLNLNLTAGGLKNAVFLSDSFWRREFHADRRVIRTVVHLAGDDAIIAGVLPRGFWFLSPAIDVYRFDTAPGGAVGMVVARCKPGVSASALEQELERSAVKSGYEFAQTAPHAIFLGEAIRTPLWLFWAALFFSAVLVVLAHGSRWIRIDGSGDLLPRRNWRWWGFFALKTTLGLFVVLVLGIEIFVGRNQQTISEALGGPSLVWFYVVGCSLVLFRSISEQHSRCRVCQRLLAFPIRIGCPGCLFLDWAGTEFLCPHGHGVLYVPHHVSCWEEVDRWVMLEA